MGGNSVAIGINLLVAFSRRMGDIRAGTLQVRNERAL
jgi:hypothetical protein